jgi:hypothetical protein
MAELMDFIKDLECTEGALPLIHMTDVFRLVQIKKASALIAKEHKRFYPGEKLLYFFYGRPSFRINADFGFTTASYFAPVCMIFDHKLIDSAFRIMPFDTGAFLDGRMEGVIHPDMDLSEFQLEVHPKTPMKLIKTFFHNELQYLTSQPVPNVPGLDDAVSETRFYVEAYNQLLRHRSNKNNDDRLHAIEIQINKNVSLGNMIKAVVIPARWFDTRIAEHIEASWRATPIPYEMPAIYDPRECMGAVFEKVKTYIVQEGLHAE